MELSTAAMSRGFDEYTISTLGVPSVTLMERAGGLIADAALRLLDGSTRAAVFCGSGNNGGDGLCAAAMLMEKGVSVRVFLTDEAGRLSRDSAVMAGRLEKAGGTCERLSDCGLDEVRGCLAACGVVIDAIYGFGFHRPMRGLAKTAAELLNAARVPVLAADIPSGVEADTGLCDESAVCADETVTFTTGKIGQFITPGALKCGRITVCDIGVSVPEGTEFTVFSVEDGDVSLPRRPRDAHKGDFGKVLIVAGSTGYTGAPSFASRAAVRTGAGLVFLGVPASIYTIEAVKNDEAMVFPLPCDEKGRMTAGALDTLRDRLRGCSVCLVGPGLGLSKDTYQIVYGIIESSTVPVIIDADGITAVSAHIDILDRARAPIVLTPHDGEFRRLGGRLDGVSRLDAARDFAARHRVTLVLKGHRTITAFLDGTAYVNTTGNPGMAKGGSGDVLAGMTAALVGQLGDVKRAVTAAVYLHGKAGDSAAMAHGEVAMTPSDIVDVIQYVTR